MGPVIYYLLIGGGGGGGGGVQKKILLCKGGGRHYMKNMNMGGCVLLTQPDQRKRPQCKNEKKNAKNYQTLKNFPRSFRSLGILQNSYFWSS